MWVQACVNGDRRRDEHPALPVTAEELATDVARAAAAGAVAVHVHVKDRDGQDTFDAEASAEALRAIRRAAPGIPVGVTTGAWALPDARARCAAIRSWTELPDVASVNWHEDGADEVAATLRERGIGIEAGLWHEEAVERWLSSPHRAGTGRVLIELQPDLPAEEVEGTADRMLARIRARAGTAAPVLLHGEGATCWPALELARRRGLAGRIGLEDTLTLPDGSVAADNAALVRAARTIITRP